MGLVNQGTVEIEEVTSILTPTDGVSIWQALLEANLSGWYKMELIAEPEPHAVITWYKRKD